MSNKKSFELEIPKRISHILGRIERKKNREQESHIRDDFSFLLWFGLVLCTRAKFLNKNAI